MAAVALSHSVPDHQVYEKQDDLRVERLEPVISPDLLRAEIPLSAQAALTIARSRQEASDVVTGKSDKLMVIVGPCSIHNPAEAVEFADLLKDAMPGLSNLTVIMRCYFEKPRTTVGWKGLINDPELDGSFRINDGLRVARTLLARITDMGVPVGCELLDTISPQMLADCMSWGAIGARTTESQLHRELASGCSFPVGFKNGTDGSLSVSIDAMVCASSPHAFMGIASSGLASVVKTTGNDESHVILRGGTSGTNYDAHSVATAKEAITKAADDKVASIVIDASHGNSEKNHENQAKVVATVCEQLRTGERSIHGIMMESNLKAGKQGMPNGKEGLQKGVSVTDACIDWDTTLVLLRQLNTAVGERRAAVATRS